MKSLKAAIITGIGGQDGSYLAEHLLAHGYRVVGTLRAGTDAVRIAQVRDQLELVELDLLDPDRLAGTLDTVRPDEVYNLAGHSFVPTSWDRPDLLEEATGQAAARWLKAIRVVDPTIRFYQASSSEIFGNAFETPQRESTSLNPRNPYGSAKAHAHLATARARDELGLFAVAGILYNHESPRRGLEFVSRKVTDGAARIALGLADSLPMGSLDAVRDWGFAGDYVRAMWLMLQQPQPRDYLISSGIPHTVRDLCRVAFAHVGLDYQRHVTLDPALVRPPETVRLIGDPSRAMEELGWRPEVSFEQLIGMMVDADLERHQRPSAAGRSSAGA